MDHEECSTPLDVLQGIPDPRKARGQRYPWLLLLALVSAALASGQKGGHAVAHWVSLHAAELYERLRPPRATMPSESTLRRALRDLDILMLEKRLARHSQYLAAQGAEQGTITTESGQVLQGQAMDGKEVRGARAYGKPLHLLSLAQHGSGRVLAQVAIEAKHNEITAAPQLLADRDLRGTVTTMDAMHTQVDFAQQILDQHGHYLMVVKKTRASCTMPSPCSSTSHPGYPANKPRSIKSIVPQKRATVGWSDVSWKQAQHSQATLTGRVSAKSCAASTSALSSRQKRSVPRPPMGSPACASPMWAPPVSSSSGVAIGPLRTASIVSGTVPWAKMLDRPIRDTPHMPSPPCATRFSTCSASTVGPTSPMRFDTMPPQSKTAWA